ncbi:MAG: LytTR family DNA-binding domain-containing protein [Tenuifilaceae bacterium]|jgi:DNA-binding LytR/AlgR family response regulator|nr:LytTR family DNA-binding domain-containing protein [Tenuifilaceae bacterium]
MNPAGKYRCVIIDDEPIAIKVIENYLNRLDGFVVAATFTNALDALGIFREQKVDLLFLDIQMPGINGLEFYKSIHNPPKLIFTTAFRSFAADAFEVNALDYLVKPIPFDRFLKAISKFLDQSSSTTRNSFLADAGSIVFKSDKKNYRVNIADILFIESLDDYVRVHTLNQRLVCYLRLSALQEQLKDSPDIIRVHRSFLVNVKHITVFTSYSIEIAGKSIPIGRSYREIVGEALKTLLPRI